MIALEQTVAVLLCAGLSQRYGPGNKLLAPVDGKPLAMHAAELCAGIPFAGRVAVVPPEESVLHGLLLGFGLDLVINPDPAAGKGSSLRLGLAWALDRGAGAAMVLLGDMPHVPEAHLRALSDAADQGVAAISIAENIMSPPTLMPIETAKRVLALTERPVRSSLGHAVCVVAPPSVLVDYDFIEQFDEPGAHEGRLPLGRA